MHSQQEQASAEISEEITSSENVNSSGGLLDEKESIKSETNKKNPRAGEEWLLQRSTEDDMTDSMLEKYYNKTEEEEAPNQTEKEKRAPIKRPTKRLSKNEYAAIREGLGLRNEPHTDLQGINPSNFIRQS